MQFSYTAVPCQHANELILLHHEDNRPIPANHRTVQGPLWGSLHLFSPKTVLSGGGNHFIAVSMRSLCLIYILFVHAIIISKNLHQLVDVTQHCAITTSEELKQDATGQESGGTESNDVVLHGDYLIRWLLSCHSPLYDLGKETMQVEEIRTIARDRGLKPGKLKKLELVRFLQQEEGNPQCFATAYAGVCDQSACLWRKDCFAAARKLNN